MGKYVPVSAAEAYARDGADRPVCECCGKLKRWGLSSNHILGGFYLCSTRANERNKKWEDNNPGQAVRKADQKRLRRLENPEAEREKTKRQYERRVRGGLCSRCGRKNDTPTTRCSHCASYLALYTMCRIEIR